MSVLLEEIASFPNLIRAWKILKKRLPVEELSLFNWHLEENLLDVSESLIKGSYCPACEPVGCHISLSGKKIPISSPKDRLVALAMKEALLRKIEPSFIYDTYAGIPLRGVHRAVVRVAAFQRKVAMPSFPRGGWILKADVKDFYPSVSHDILLGLCMNRMKDKEAVNIISRFLEVWGRWQNTPGKGIPLGSSLSALLANLYLDPFDHFLKDDLGFKLYVRYADDMAFLSTSRAELELILGKTEEFLIDSLGLCLNKRKTFFKPTADGMDFLGYRIFYHHLLLRKKNMRKIKMRLCRMSKEYACGEIKVSDIKTRLAGWLGYAGFANSYNFRKRLFSKVCFQKTTNE